MGRTIKSYYSSAQSNKMETRVATDCSKDLYFYDLAKSSDAIDIFIPNETEIGTAALNNFT